MAKDPAFLFYASDFLTGTMFMTNEQVGLYVRMLCAQHQHGGRIDTNVLRTQCDAITGGDTVWSKFVHDESGSYNERLCEEMEKRKTKSVKAAESVAKRWEKQRQKQEYERSTNVVRSENENEIENKDKRKKKRGAGEKEKPFEPPTLDEVCAYVQQKGFSNDMAETFHELYTSTNWIKKNGDQIKDWKLTMNTWMREPHNQKFKIQTEAPKRIMHNPNIKLY